VNLVNELQVSAEQDDVLTVLRKTKRLASKLNRHDIAEWLESEQNGYSSRETVPDYRTVGVTLGYNTNGYIPAGWGMLVKGTEMLPDCGLGLKFPIPDSISIVLSWIESKGRAEELCSPVPAGSDLCRKLKSMFRFDQMIARQITFLFRYNGAEIRAIPERIKDRVLNWACDLESAGVTGEGMTFSAKEKEIAHAVTFNIYGSHIEQLSNSGTNLKGS
jgi:AbiTii